MYTILVKEYKDEKLYPSTQIFVHFYLFLTLDISLSESETKLCKLCFNVEIM